MGGRSLERRSSKDRRCSGRRSREYSHPRVQKVLRLSGRRDALGQRSRSHPPRRGRGSRGLPRARTDSHAVQRDWARLRCGDRLDQVSVAASGSGEASRFTPLVARDGQRLGLERVHQSQVSIWEP